MPNRYKNVDGVRIELSDEEEAARDAEEKAVADAAPAKALAALRKKRDILLAETDYYGCSDMTMSDDMKTYRQELRDLPSGKDTVKKCEDATWPTKP